MALSRYGGVTGTKNISEDFENINVAFNNVAAENDGIKSDVNRNKQDLENHKNSSAAHPAQNIPYSGAVLGANNTKQALDNLKQEINDLVLGSGDSGPEVSAARGGYPTLGDRLDASDAKLADIANPNLLINGDFRIFQRYPTSEYNGVPVNIYIADRWLFLSTDGSESNKILLPGDGIVNSAGPDILLSYLMEEDDLKRIRGKVCTSSVKYAENENPVTNTFTVPANATQNHAMLSINLPTGRKIEYVKLELGAHATPNVSRHFATELDLCQRYCNNLISGFYSELGVGISSIDNAVYLTIPLATTPRLATPTYQLKGTFSLTVGASEYLINSEDITITSTSGINGNVKLSGAGIPNINPGLPVKLRANLDSSFIIDAEIYY